MEEIKNDKKTKKISVRFTPHEYKMVHDFCKNHGYTMAPIIAHAAIKHIKDLREKQSFIDKYEKEREAK